MLFKAYKYVIWIWIWSNVDEGDEGGGDEGDGNRNNLFEGSWNTLLPAKYK